MTPQIRYIALAAMLAGMAVPATAGPAIREYEDALVIAEGERSALRLSLHTDDGTGHSHVRFATLYDPYGEPYLTVQRESQPPAAIDWGVDECLVGGRSVGPFRGDSPYRTFERWSRGDEREDSAELVMQRAWLDPVNRQAFALETARITVHAQQYYRRAIDLHVRLVNVGSAQVVIPADASFVVRFDATRPQAGFLTPENEFRNGSFRYRGPWLAGSSMALARMKIVGIALFNDAVNRAGDAAEFIASRDGTLQMSASAARTVLEPGESTEWSARIFCYADKLPARAIQDSYLGYLSGRNW